MKKIVLLLLVISCSPNDSLTSSTIEENLIFNIQDYYTMNDGLREDYSFNDPGVIEFSNQVVSIVVDDIDEDLTVKDINGNIYSVWHNVVIDNDDGTPRVTVVENLTVEILSDKIVIKDDDHPEDSGSYYEIHYLLL